MLKIIVSVVFGLAVTVVCVLSLWRGAGDGFYNNHALISWTLGRMRSVATAIETYYIDNKAYPPSVTSVSEYLGNPDIPLDMWDNPLIYKVHYAEDGKSSYTLKSYGRDGKPGGRNTYERDLVYPAEAQTPEDGDEEFSQGVPTFAQFVAIKYTHKGLGICVFAGGIAFLLSLRILPRDFCWKNQMTRQAVFYLFVVFLAALFVTYILGSLHVPSNH